jgi:hypothetical protein
MGLVRTTLLPTAEDHAGTRLSAGRGGLEEQQGVGGPQEVLLAVGQHRNWQVFQPDQPHHRPLLHLAPRA